MGVRDRRISRSLTASTGVGEEGKDERNKAVCSTTLVSSGVIPKCKRTDALQLGGSFIFTWSPQQSVPQMRTACVNWKQAIRLPFQTELIS